MSELNLEELNGLPEAEQTARLALSQRRLEQLSAEERVAWALEKLPETHVLSSSFGIQAAVSLHLLTQFKPRIPVILIDTGYLFPETYHFIDILAGRLELNMKVYRSSLSPTWLEARYGRIWEQGVAGLDRYNQIVKVEPMQQALNDLNAHTWFTGLRRSQSSSRADLPVLQFSQGRFKVHPISDWSNQQIHRYLKEHDLPYHPLWEKGYVSVGDIHTSRPLEPGMSEEETRFFGLKRECGLHDP